MKPIPLLLLVIATLPVHAQQAAQAPSTPSASAALPDIEFAADVHMDSITFGSAPRAHVDILGGPRLEQRHDVEREGLPTPVKAGTYHDVTVRTTISATLLDPSLDGPAPAADATVQTTPTSPPSKDTP